MGEGVESDFELRVELYSCSMDETPPLSATPRKLANKLRSSLGKAAGRKLRPLLDSGEHDDFLQTHPLPQGVSFSLLAVTSLGLQQAGRSFLSHPLKITQTAESSSWLPLYGNVCCRLLAQPDCMRLPTHSGPLRQQVCVEGVFRSCSLHCELQGETLSCWLSPEEVFLTVPVTMDTRVRVLRDQHGSGSAPYTMTISTPGSAPSTHVFQGHAPELHDWAAALSQHTHNLRSWKHCCEELMQIEVLSPRKPPLFHSKQPETVYSEMCIISPGKFESVTDIIHNKIEETGGRFLIGQGEQAEPPNWSALFEGSRPLVVQKVVMSPGKEPCHSSFSPVAHGNKKRKAPPPPPDKLPYTTPTPTMTTPTPTMASSPEKENVFKTTSSNLEKGRVLKAPPRSGRPSLDNAHTEDV
ncbi:rhotekin-2-like [Clupea harengus]|uniref:Rhotekin-2-like n=1 Tax=Clupea harengus TaxID=7950 RepID=A0A6P8FI96_CLUHA|nr:rhotekin-2-like [Clupea harengus]